MKLDINIKEFKPVIEVGDVIYNGVRDMWQIVESMDATEYSWVNLTNGRISSSSYDTIEELIKVQFDEELITTGKSIYFNVLKSKDLIVTEVKK